MRQQLEAGDSTQYPIFGGEPIWLQSPAPPSAPDGEPMRFIGQLNASAFTGNDIDFQLFVFYSKKHRLTTQIVQIS